MRLGLLRQNTEKFNTLEITNEGVLALKERRKIILTKPREAPKVETKKAGEIACDENLFEKLRILRKELADQLGVPPYIVFGDNTLRQMARFYPQSESEFRKISGVGDQKWRSYGAAFNAEIAQHLVHNPRQIFADDSFETPTPAEDRRTRGERLNGTSLESLRRFRAGQAVASIASERGLAESTIYGHIATAVEAGESIELRLLFSREDLAAIQKAFEVRGLTNLSGVIEELGGRYDYGRLRVCRAVLSRLGRL
jgi:ATP-dependent DNA helicase RecQ